MAARSGRCGPAGIDWPILGNEAAMSIEVYKINKYRKIEGQWLQSEMRLEIFFLTPYEEGWHKTRMMS